MMPPNDPHRAPLLDAGSLPRSELARGALARTRAACCRNMQKRKDERGWCEDSRQSSAHAMQSTR